MARARTWQKVGWDHCINCLFVSTIPDGCDCCLANQVCFIGVIDTFSNVGVVSEVLFWSLCDRFVSVVLPSTWRFYFLRTALFLHCSSIFDHHRHYHHQILTHRLHCHSSFLDQFLCSFSSSYSFLSSSMLGNSQGIHIPIPIDGFRLRLIGIKAKATSGQSLQTK